MGRPYSDKLILELHKSERTDIGAELARACINANLPAKHVATVLGATRMTVYNWFWGSTPMAYRKDAIEYFINRVNEDIKKGTLPTGSDAASKTYLVELLGIRTKL